MIWSANKKIVTWFIFGAGIMLFPTRSLACSCAGTLPFTKVAQNSEVIIIRGKVYPYVNNKSFWNLKELEILEVMKGQEIREKARIWGDNGGQCRPNISLLPNGTEWVIALERVSPYKEVGMRAYRYNLESSIEVLKQEIDYALIGCDRPNALQVVGKEAQETVSKYETQKLSLEKLRELIDSWN